VGQISDDSPRNQLQGQKRKGKKKNNSNKKLIKEKTNTTVDERTGVGRKK